MSGDPVEEGAVAVRTGFIQALQTGAMTANLMQRRGAESRSVAEFDRRTADAAAKEDREVEFHDLKVDSYHDRHRRETELHTLETQFKLGQQQRANELHELDKQIKKRQMQRADADFDRRNTDGILERGGKGDLYALDKQWRGNREKRLIELHDLDVEYKQLLIDGRKRSLGLTEVLAAQDQSTATANQSAAEFAAAHSSRDLSPEHADHADAYAERFAQDAGYDPQDLIDEALITVNTEPTLSTISEFTAELATEIYAEHLIGTGSQTGPTPDSDEAIANAITAAIWLTGEDGIVTVLDVDQYPDLDVESPGVDLDPDLGLEP
ncbi:hypothetical protein ACQPW1_22435 [Nocardia sp. CA-128927]|uniref:hypothetical protein n=1 Tax=Nocardia sp. CA-128927 TaxID=3239975 RepID=UPI003D9707A3